MASSALWSPSTSVVALCAWSAATVGAAVLRSAAMFCCT